MLIVKKKKKTKKKSRKREGYLCKVGEKSDNWLQMRWDFFFSVKSDQQLTNASKQGMDLYTVTSGANLHESLNNWGDKDRLSIK